MRILGTESSSTGASGRILWSTGDNFASLKNTHFHRGGPFLRVFLQKKTLSCSRIHNKKQLRIPRQDLLTIDVVIKEMWHLQDLILYIHLQIKPLRIAQSQQEDLRLQKFSINQQESRHQQRCSQTFTLKKQNMLRGRHHSRTMDLPLSQTYVQRGHW